MNWRQFSESTIGILAIYLGLTVLFTWPLVPQMATHLPHGSNDIWQNYWNFWWWREALFELGTNPYWTAYQFHPYGASLALHTHSTFNQIVGLPINLALGPIAALNFTTLLGFFLSGVAAHHLAFEISKNRSAAYLAGLIFAFFPHHFEQSLEHLNLSSLQFLPWVALYGMRTFRGGTRRDTVLFGVVFALNTLACLHYALFTLFILPWLWAVDCFRERYAVVELRNISGRLVAAGAVTLLIMAPFLTAMLLQADLETYAKTTIDKGIDFAFLWLPSDHNPILGMLTSSFYETHRAYPSLGSQAYLGYTVLFLACIAWVRSPKDRNVVAWSLVFGSSLLLSLGANPTFAGEAVGIKLPHALFEHIPVLKGLRVANRFIVISMLALSVLASIGFVQAFAQRRGAALVCFLLISFEYLWLPYPMQRVEALPILERIADEATGAVLDIPYSDHGLSAPNLAYQIQHGRPIIGGYISVAPRGDAFLGRDPVLRQLAGLVPHVPRRIDIEHFRSLGISHVVMHKDRTVEALNEAVTDLPASTHFYKRRQFQASRGMPEEIFEKISRKFAAAVGPPVFEDRRIRVYQLSPQP
ncbi:MAG: hypothetical protein ACI8W3_000659 [Myxococcota bacterium]|jgi:hypothetical protein